MRECRPRSQAGRKQAQRLHDLSQPAGGGGAPGRFLWQNVTEEPIGNPTRAGTLSVFGLGEGLAFSLYEQLSID